jgi:hypothetical protein
MSGRTRGRSSWRSRAPGSLSQAGREALCATPFCGGVDHAAEDWSTPDPAVNRLGDRAGGGKQGQVLAFHGAVEGALQGVQVGDLDVAELAVLVDVNALLGQQRRETRAASRAPSPA